MHMGAEQQVHDMKAVAWKCICVCIFLYRLMSLLHELAPHQGDVDFT